MSTGTDDKVVLSTEGVDLIRDGRKILSSIDVRIEQGSTGCSWAPTEPARARC